VAAVSNRHAQYSRQAVENRCHGMAAIS